MNITQEDMQSKFMQSHERFRVHHLAMRFVKAGGVILEWKEDHTNFKFHADHAHILKALQFEDSKI